MDASNNTWIMIQVVYFKIFISFIEWEQTIHPKYSFAKQYKTAMGHLSFIEAINVLTIVYMFYKEELPNFLQNNFSLLFSIILIVILLLLLKRFFLFLNTLTFEGKIAIYYHEFHKEGAIGIFSLTYSFLSFFCPTIITLIYY